MELVQRYIKLEGKTHCVNAVNYRDNRYRVIFCGKIVQ